MISTGLTQAEVTNLIQLKLKALRDALTSVAELYGWTSGITPTDLSSASTYSVSDASGVMAAIADANALASYYNTGEPPLSYPQAVSSYTYGASQRAVIGPQ